MSTTYRLFVLPMTLTLLAGCVGSMAGEPSAQAPATSAATQVVTVAAASNRETPAATTPAAQSTTAVAPAADPATLCPQETANATLYVSIENGFCFLYPSTLTPQPDALRPAEAVQLLGPLADPGAMETVALNLTVANNGGADGLDSTGYASAWLQRNVPGMELAQTSATIGGQSATVIDNLPGMIGMRGAFVVAGNVKYQITMQPLPQDIPQLADAATQAWDTITQSLVFFPPQNQRTVVRASDVCPAVTADTKLLIDEVGGYCLLYPADFDVDPNMPGIIAGGPELGPFGDFPSVRASLGIGTYSLVDQTPEQALQPPPENSDLSSVQSTTIAGYPAVTYDFIAGPWRQRNAAVVVDDRVYTFVAGPWDANLFPQALPDVERLWTTATASVAFFDPWR